MPRNCPIAGAMNKYSLDSGSVLHMVRMNWRLSVLSIISAADGDGIRYHNIAGMSGLNPRTLSIILKELEEKRLIDKVSGTFGNKGAYRVTNAGTTVVNSDCPLVKIALTERSKTRRLYTLLLYLTASAAVLLQFATTIPFQ